MLVLPTHLELCDNFEPISGGKPKIVKHFQCLLLIIGFVLLKLHKTHVYVWKWICDVSRSSYITAITHSWPRTSHEEPKLVLPAARWPSPHHGRFCIGHKENADAYMDMGHLEGPFSSILLLQILRSTLRTSACSVR